MLLVPNHHVIVPETRDLYFQMPNKITTNEGTQRGAFQVRLLAPWYRYYDLPVEIKVRSIHDIEIYTEQFRPYSGYRLINHGAYNLRVHPGKPWSEFVFERRRLPDESGWYPGGGRVRVVAGEMILPAKLIIDQIQIPIPETTNEPGKRGLVIRFDNFRSYDYYEKRFNPGRYASSRAKVGATQPPTSSPAGEYNYMARRRVGDSLYTEPVVLVQPLWGYARLTSDRRGLLYVPYKGFQGTDAFTYTLITQHGQIGQPRTITVDVYDEAPPVQLKMSVSSNVIYAGSNVIFTVDTVSIPPETELPFTVTGANIEADDFSPIISSNVSSEFNHLNQNGLFVLDLKDTGVNECRAILPIQTYIDNDAQDETFKLALDDYPAISANVTIKPAAYELIANVTNVYEGDAVRFTLKQFKSVPTIPTLPDGLQIEYYIQGLTRGLQPVDFDPVLVNPRGYFTLQNGQANVVYGIAADQKTESYPWLPILSGDQKVEQFRFKLTHGPHQVDINIIDTSRDPADMPALPPTPTPTPWTLTPDRYVVLGGMPIKFTWTGTPTQPAYTYLVVNSYTMVPYTGTGIANIGTPYNLPTISSTGNFTVQTSTITSKETFEVIIVAGATGGELKARSATIQMLPRPQYGRQLDGSISCPGSLDGVELLEAGIVVDDTVTVTASLVSPTPGLWGNNEDGYSADSDISRAVIHAGLLLSGQTAKIRVLSLGLKPYFTGTVANGITSQNLYSPWCAIRLALA